MAEPALGVLLQYLRDARGLSLRELGQLANVDHAYIYRLETGAKESPSEELLTKLIRALKAPKRESDMLRYVAEHAETESALVRHVLTDPTVTYELFTSVAAVAYRGKGRPDYPKLIARMRQIIAEEEGSG